jgi:hypothetical protein
MNAGFDPHAPDPAETPETRSPTVFVRTLSVPPGAPWDQARAAALEARVGAPLPLADVVYQLHRLDTWSLGRPARYAACYVRAQEAGDDFETTVSVDGRSVRVRFLSMDVRARQAKRVGVIAAVAGLTALLVVAGLTSALSVRAETADRLANAEMLSARRLAKARAEAQLVAQTRLLDAAGVRHRGIGDLLEDIAWASSAKAPEAHIDSLHWERGYMAVEVRGDGPAFAQPDRAVLKADKQARPGVWLWGVEPAHPGDGGATAPGAAR